MRYLVLLVFLGGCAAPYTGVTQAQIKWSDAYWRCEGQNTDDCKSVRARFAIEDKQERDAIRYQAQAQMNAQRALGATQGAAAAYRPQPIQVQPLTFGNDRSLNCTTTYYGSQAQTRCR